MTRARTKLSRRHLLRGAAAGAAAVGLATVKKPCVVIAGTEDTLTRPDTVAEVAAAIPGARYQTVAGAGHMIPIEQPEPFDRLLNRFLVDHLPAVAPVLG